MVGALVGVSAPGSGVEWFCWMELVMLAIEMDLSCLPFCWSRTARYQSLCGLLVEEKRRFQIMPDKIQEPTASATT